MTNFSNNGNMVTFTVSAVGPQGAAGAQGAAGLPFSAITPVVASQAVAANLSGSLFTNTGATGEVDITLPSAPSPLTPVSFSLFVAESETCSFIAPAGVTIQNSADISSSGGSISSNTVGNFVTITIVSATQWIVSAISGLWELN